MKKVCISYDTGGGRRGGHYTHYSFTGLPGVEIAALADSNPEAEKNFRLTGATRRISRNRLEKSGFSCPTMGRIYSSIKVC